MAGPNTANERGACLNLFLGFGRLMPNPDVGAESAADRQQLALSYPGILVGSVMIPSVLEDLTTLWCQEFQPALHALSPGDDTTRSRKRIDAEVIGYDNENDLNTALAKYIDAEM